MMRPIAIASLGVLLATAGCENDPQEIDALSRKVMEVEEGRNIRALFSQAGNRKAYLTAPYMRRVKADTLYAEFPQSIHVDFYNEQQQLQNVVTARYARYFESLAKVFLRDSVVVYNLNGDTLRCQTLWWNQNEELFYTSDTVLIHTVTQQLRGTGFRAKSDFSKYTIDNTVGTVVLPGQGADSTAPAADSTATRPPAAAPARQ